MKKLTLTRHRNTELFDRADVNLPISRGSGNPEAETAVLSAQRNFADCLVVSEGQSRYSLEEFCATQQEIMMKISARNQLSGTVVEVTKGATTSHVRIDIGGTIVTASITNEAVDELGLVKGKKATAIIKASDVLVGV